MYTLKKITGKKTSACRFCDWLFGMRCDWRRDWLIPDCFLWVEILCFNVLDWHMDDHGEGFMLCQGCFTIIWSNLKISSFDWYPNDVRDYLDKRALCVQPYRGKVAYTWISQIGSSVWWPLVVFIEMWEIEEVYIAVKVHMPSVFVAWYMRTLIVKGCLSMGWSLTLF